MTDHFDGSSRSGLVRTSHRLGRKRPRSRSVRGLAIVLGSCLAVLLAHEGYPPSTTSMLLLAGLGSCLATLSAALLASPMHRLVAGPAARSFRNSAVRRRDAILFRRLALLCCKEDFPYRQQRVATLVNFLALKAGSDPGQRRMFAIAATLHRVGFVCLPASPGGDHAETARRAADMALRLLDGPTPLHRLAMEMARAHEESWDGAGSPHGLAGEQIPFSARLLQVALALDALLPRTGRRLDRAALAAICARLEAAAGHTLDPALAVLPSRHLVQLGRLLAQQPGPAARGYRAGVWGGDWHTMFHPADPRPMFTLA